MAEGRLSGFLEEMKRRKRDEVRSRLSHRSAAALEKVAAERTAAADFAAALELPSGGKVRLIAEMKRASPSAGVIREAFEPLSLARRVVQAGAVAVSVLTEEEFFLGSLKDLSRVAEGVSAPVMRKDFLVDTYQLLEARAAGAAACLLIAAMVSDVELRQLVRDTIDLGMTPLVETHDRRDIDAALEAGAGIIGINNRDLKTLEVNTATTLELIKFIPGDRIVVSESGLNSRGDLEILEAAGIHAALVGEAVMGADDVAGKVRELLGLDDGRGDGLQPSAGKGVQEG